MSAILKKNTSEQWAWVETPPNPPGPEALRRMLRKILRLLKLAAAEESTMSAGRVFEVEGPECSVKLEK